MPSSKVILRSYGRWSASFPAFDLLNMSAKSWYSSGSVLKLTGAEVVAERPVVSGTEIRSWKCWVSLSLQARANAEALINVTHGGFRFTGGRGVSGSGTGFRRARVGADDKVSTGGDILASGCDDWQKMMRPNTQSIEGLNWVSQQNPSTIVQPWSNRVTKNVRF